MPVRCRHRPQQCGRPPVERQHPLAITCRGCNARVVAAGVQLRPDEARAASNRLAIARPSFERDDPPRCSLRQSLWDRGAAPERIQNLFATHHSSSVRSEQIRQTLLELRQVQFGLSGTQDAAHNVDSKIKDYKEDRATAGGKNS